MACELLCCGVEAMDQTLIEHKENLERLFGFFEENKINLLLANCVVRVINALLTTKSKDVSYFYCFILRISIFCFSCHT